MKETIRARLTALCFFSMGLWISLLAITVSWIATEDILSGTDWSTTVVSLAFFIPELLSKVLSPFIIRRISFLCSMVVLTVLLVGALLIIVLIKNVDLRIAGVGIHGAAYSFGQVACYAMLSYYDNADDYAMLFSWGLNAAALLSSFGYTGLTTWLCVAPRIAIACLIPLCILPLFFYALLDKEPLKSHCDKKNIKYSTLQEQKPHKSTTKMFDTVLKVMPYGIYAYIGNFSLHLSMTAILSTVTFPEAPFPPRDHYQYYRLVNDIGYFVGGVERVFFSCFCSQWKDLFKIRRVWILVVLNVACLFLYLMTSWFRFVNNVYVMMLVVFAQGVLQGSISVNTIGLVANLFKSAAHKATAMVFVEASNAFGRVNSALLGLFIERYLRNHCTNDLHLGEFCLARHPTLSGWSASENCKI